MIVHYNHHRHRVSSASFLSKPRPSPYLRRLFSSSFPFLSKPRTSTLTSSFSLSSLKRSHQSNGRDPIQKEIKGPERESVGRRGEERPVHCEVDVVSWRERRIRARVVVAADVDSVWTVLTDYERLADFIPNLVYSGTVPCPHEGRIWLEQRGMQRALYWHIEARVLLDLQEFPNSVNGNELHFSMVDGDFKKFEGKWSVKAIPRSKKATLSYEVNVIPKFNFPAMFIERIISSDLPVNLQALACRSETFSKTERKICTSGNTAFASGKASQISSAMSYNDASRESSETLVEDLPEHFSASAVTSLPSPSIADNINKWGIFAKVCNLDRPCMVDEVHLRRFDGLLENGGVHRCVVASITVKAPLCEVWNVLTAYEKLPEIVPNLAISKVLLRENNKVRILQEGCKGLLYMVLHARVVLDLHEIFEQEITFEQAEGDFDSFHGKWILEQLGNQHTLLKYAIESKLHKDTFLSEAIVEEVIYEDLPSNLCAIQIVFDRIVPNLAISKVLLRENNKVRILQEGCKGLLYMVLHARVVLDLHEIFEQEITFEQAEGDFDSFHGKWILEQLGNQHTLLKYAIESKLHKDTFLSEAIVEEVIYEDLPSNLCAIRDFVENRKPPLFNISSSTGSSQNTIVVDDNKLHAGEVSPAIVVSTCNEVSSTVAVSTSNTSISSKQRSKVPGLQRDIDVLKSELFLFISKHGQEGFMPMRKQLRLHGRVDIEKAIARMGGFRKIANSMNLSLAYKDRKPKGYWDNLENLQEEISRFQRSWGMDPTYMPSRKSFERAGRYDIARALEKWGGLHEVSRLLSLELRHPRSQANSVTEKNKNDSSPSYHSGSKEKGSASQDTENWLLKLKDLDINWLE